jgi:ankyrin repeat protein
MRLNCYVDAGADINAKETWGGQSALMWAAARCQADMVKFLASKGANLNDHGKANQWERKILLEPRPKDMNKGGFTALHYAAREGCPGAVQNLLTAGADPDSEDPDRRTPLLMALMNMHFDTAAVLVKGERISTSGTSSAVHRSTWRRTSAHCP